MACCRVDDHTGWFVNSFQDETVHGMVYRLPARDGKPLYAPAVSDHCGNPGSCFSFRDVTEDLIGAIREADRLAECWAESEREYEARENARLRIEENREQIKSEYAEFRKLAREIRANCEALGGMVELKKVLHREYRRVKTTVCKLRREIGRLEDNYWEAVGG